MACHGPLAPRRLGEELRGTRAPLSLGLGLTWTWHATSAAKWLEFTSFLASDLIGSRLIYITSAVKLGVKSCGSPASPAYNASRYVASLDIFAVSLRYGEPGPDPTNGRAKWHRKDGPFWPLDFEIQLVSLLFRSSSSGFGARKEKERPPYGAHNSQEYDEQHGRWWWSKKEVMRPKLYTSIGQHARSPRLSRTIVRRRSPCEMLLGLMEIDRF